ncbi:uncharacterized protein LOC118235520 [Anguilla anguilla]|uniref:uncharacterized protein LOC118235520 n=1 Tax=Anguilla anguilla TaxID=7936 RepID=UPI0015B1B164|nr:uncharacterized protein LOC118235520 [Anguilla anguilla]
MEPFAWVLLYGVCFQGAIFGVSWAWSVTVPREMEGMVGSCLVIPCRFSYSEYPPNDKGRVVWYQYVDRGYPLVCDPKNPNEVIEKFRGKTSLYGSPYNGDCSLKIYPLDWRHQEERVYPWVDPDYVTYHYFKFYDKAVKIRVRDRADEPKLYFSGSRTVGEQMTVQCSAYHTCRPRPPTLRLTVAGHTGTPKVYHTEVHEGKWKITMEMIWTLDNAHQTITCEVKHPSGRSASKTVSLKGQCSVTKVTINPSSEEFLEGVEKDVVCSVSYACQEQRPDLSWNYGGMKVSSEFKKRGSGSWESRSILKFKAGASDHNQALKCTARFTNGQTQEGYITLKVKRAMFSLGWSFSMPSQVTGLQGSCLVIPCHFEYSSTLPSDISVMWYKYTPGEYTVVFSAARPGDVISDFSGKTSLYGSPSDRSCSLKINPVEMNHHRQRLYTWVDPKPISSYHRQNYQDKTVEIYVTDRVDKPEMQIIGIPKVGEQISVQCSAYHMCPATPPILSLIGFPETGQAHETQAQDVKWKTTLVQTWVIVEDQQTLSCRVQHPGGQEAQADITIQAECSVGEIITDPGPVEFLEGVVKNVTCSVFYTCSKQQPAIVWSYKDMPASSKTTKMAATKWKTVSSIMFIASMDDHGKTLTCTAEFPDGKRPMASIDLHVKMYEPPAPESPTAGPDTDDTSSISHIWAASVTPRISALTQSCVVIPCGFTSESEYPVTGLSGMWQTRDGGYAYHNGQSRVTNNFKGRTRLVGDLDEQNCTLEIDEVKPHDNGPFCFRAEKGTDKYTFNNSCVFIVMKASPSDPVMTPLWEETKEGSALSATCSVEHTCPTHPPTFTWNVKDGKTTTSHTQSSPSTWKTSSTLTFIPAGDNYEEQLTCSATFWRRKRQDSSASLNVKRKQSLLPILLPATAAALLALALCVGVLTCRKRCSRKSTDQHSLRSPQPDTQRSFWKRFSRRHEGNSASWNVGNTGHRELPRDCPRSPPRPEERASFWRRFSRRNPKDFLDRPSRPEKRRSIWSRFSRQQHGNGPEMNVGYRANNESLAGNVPTKPKPHFPSPVRNPKSAHAAKHRNDTPYFEEEEEEEDYENCFKEDIYANM